jgi:low affinity Fe/Cu permease
MSDVRRGSSFGSAFGRFARAVNEWASSPKATFLAFLCVVVWAAFGPAAHYSEDWQLIINTGTTIVTFLMVFILNNAQSRDTAAMNAKLDELILSIRTADNRLIGVERKSDEDAAELRSDIAAAVERAVKKHEQARGHKHTVTDETATVITKT